MFTLADLKNGKTSLQVNINFESIPDSIMLFKSGKWYLASDAIIQTGLGLGGIYKIFMLAYIFPKRIRDAVYNYIAKNRYKWFGKQHPCDI